MGKIGARKSALFKAVCTAPSFNKTPVGSSTPAIPYPTIQDLSNGVAVALSVRFNGQAAYVLNSTVQPGCKGDDPGVAGGVKSGTVNGFVKPVDAAAHFRAEKKHVVRQGDPNVMNGGNNPGVYITAQAPAAASAAAKAGDGGAPLAPVQPETPAESAFLAAQGDPLGDLSAPFSNDRTLIALALGCANTTLPALLCVALIPGKKE